MKTRKQISVVLAIFFIHFASDSQPILENPNRIIVQKPTIDPSSSASKLLNRGPTKDIFADHELKKVAAQKNFDLKAQNLISAGIILKLKTKGTTEGLGENASSEKNRNILKNIQISNDLSSRISSNNKGCALCMPAPGVPMPGGVPGVNPVPEVSPPLGPTIGPKVSYNDWSNIFRGTKSIYDEILESRLPEAFDPVGFLEVVLIRNLASNRICTGTLLSKNIILTAAHCARTGKDSLRVWIPSKNEAKERNCKIEIAVGNYVPCTEFILTKVTRVHLYQDEKLLANQANTTANDLAILEIVWPLNVQEPIYPKLASLGTLYSEITMPGYGNTRNPNRNPYAVEVGWQRNISVSDLDIQFKFDANRRENSGACFGDSGAPVYSGHHQGAIKEARIIVGIVSSGRSKDTNCSDTYDVSVTRLGNSTVNQFFKNIGIQFAIASN